LTDEQKANRVTVTHELFDRSNADDNFLKTVKIGDEMWVYRYNIETKVQSSQWVGKSSLQPKIAGQSRPYVLLIFLSLSLDWKGIVHHEFVPRCQTVNG
jgi:hypothetical protein